MPERTKYEPGTPSWVDIQTSDQVGAKAFYTALFGWEYDDQPVGGDAVYSMAKKNGKDVAAIAPLPMEGVPPHWNTYVTVTDVDATVAQVPGAGGSAMGEPFDVMDAGRMAVVSDPTGAMLCLWQPKNHIGAYLVNEPGSFSWAELMTPDVDAALAFYEKVFGWKGNKVDMPGMEYTEIKLNDRSIGGAMKPPMEGMPAAWAVYFAVDDADQAAATTTAMGGSVIQQPTDIPPGRFAVLVDPAGAFFNVIKMAQPGE
jgi:predicted enzyme related to lactoylglutathione lyase